MQPTELVQFLSLDVFLNPASCFCYYFFKSLYTLFGFDFFLRRLIIYPRNNNKLLFSFFSKDDVDIAHSKELSAVLEITSVLQEWGDIWKQLFVVSVKRFSMIVCVLSCL